VPGTLIVQPADVLKQDTCHCIGVTPICHCRSSSISKRNVAARAVSVPKVLVRPPGQRQYEWVDLWESYVSSGWRMQTMRAGDFMLALLIARFHAAPTHTVFAIATWPVDLRMCRHSRASLVREA